MRAIAASSQLIAIDPANLPDSVWKQPPLWWTPRKGASTHVYMTPNFSFDDRGGDGDYYLFIEDGEDNRVFAIVKYNF